MVNLQAIRVQQQRNMRAQYKIARKNENAEIYILKGIILLIMDNSFRKVRNKSHAAVNQYLNLS